MTKRILKIVDWFWAEAMKASRTFVGRWMFAPIGAVVHWLGIQIALSFGGLLARILGVRGHTGTRVIDYLPIWWPLVAALAAVPWIFHEEFVLTQFSYLYIYSILILGLNILIGIAGQHSLGHAAFVTIGAYVTAFLYGGSIFGFSLPAIISIPLGAAVTGLFGLALGFPAIRARGPYLSLITLGIMLCVPALLKSVYLEPYTGGSLGIFITQPENPRWLYYLNAGTFMVMLILAHVIVDRSRLGRGLRAIRDSEAKSSVIGIDVNRYKMLAFGLSTFYAGMAGGLFAMNTGFIGSEAFTLRDSLEYLVATTVGGFGSILGSVVGGAFLTFQPQMTDALAKIIPGGDQLLWAIFGFLVIVTTFFLPRGIAGEIKYRLHLRLTRRPKRREWRRETPSEFEIDEIIEKWKSDDTDADLLGLARFAESGKVVEAWGLFKEVNRAWGTPWPKSNFSKAIQINWLTLLTICRASIGPGTERSLKTQVKVTDLACTRLKWLSGQNLDRVLLHLRLLNLGWRLGMPSYIARGLAQMAYLASDFQLTRTASSLLDRAFNVASGVREPSLKAYLSYLDLQCAYNRSRSEWEDKLARAQSELARLDEFERISHYRSLAWQYLIIGDFQMAYRTCREGLEACEHSRHQGLVSDLYCLKSQCLQALGDPAEAAKFQVLAAEKLKRDFKDIDHHLALYVVTELSSRSESGKLDADVDLIIDFFESLRVRGPLFLFGSIEVVHIRLAQMEHVTDFGRDDEGRAKQRLHEAIRNLERQTLPPHYQSHVFTIRAGLERVSGRFTNALQYADKAFSLATDQSSRGMFLAAREQARINKAMQNWDAMKTQAEVARRIAVGCGWTAAAKKIDSELETHERLAHEKSTAI